MRQQNDLRDGGANAGSSHDSPGIPCPTSARSRRSKRARAAAALPMAMGCWSSTSVGIAAVSQDGAAAAAPPSNGLAEIVITAEHMWEDA